MDAYAKENYEPSKPQSAIRLSNAGIPAHKVMESAGNPYSLSKEGTVAGLNQATTKIDKACDTVTAKVRDFSTKARSYSLENPANLIVITLGIGLGVGLLLGVNSHHDSPASRLVQSMVNALFDIATGFFR